MRLVEYEDERQLDDIMSLVDRDLSEPYSIFTYRYFLHNWPGLCFVVSSTADFVVLVHGHTGTVSDKVPKILPVCMYQLCTIFEVVRSFSSETPNPVSHMHVALNQHGLTQG